MRKYERLKKITFLCPARFMKKKQNPSFYICNLDTAVVRLFFTLRSIIKEPAGPTEPESPITAVRTCEQVNQTDRGWSTTKPSGRQIYPDIKGFRGIAAISGA